MRQAATRRAQTRQAMPTLQAGNSVRKQGAQFCCMYPVQLPKTSFSSHARLCQTLVVIPHLLAVYVCTAPLQHATMMTQKPQCMEGENWQSHILLWAPTSNLSLCLSQPQKGLLLSSSA